MSKRVLITGSSGFIGGQLFERLRGQGCQVVGLGRRHLTLPGYRVHDLVRPLPATLPPCDVVVHAAARSSPWGRRSDFERQNVLATRQVLRFCEEHGRPRLIFLSSSSVYYAAGHQLNLTEATPLPPRAINAYAATKRRAEELVRNYSGDWVILRPRAVFGPGDTVLLPRILHAARAGRLPLLTAPDGPAVGDLIYIDNLIDAIVCAVENPRVRDCVNLTNNQPVPLLDFLLDLFARLGIPTPTRRVSVRRAALVAALLEGFHALFLPGGEPPLTRFGVHVFAYSKTFDVSRMLALMGPPRVSLADGMERTVAWIERGQSC